MWISWKFQLINIYYFQLINRWNENKLYAWKYSLTNNGKLLGIERDPCLSLPLRLFITNNTILTYRNLDAFENDSEKINLHGVKENAET